MSLPNILTLSRVPLMFVVVALMYSQFQWSATIAFWLYIIAALTGWLDGKLARERGEVSAFGRFMDSVIDKVMVIGLMLLQTAVIVAATDIRRNELSEIAEHAGCSRVCNPGQAHDQAADWPHDGIGWFAPLLRTEVSQTR